MILEPNEEQEFFRSTTAKFLAERAPADAVRQLRDDPIGFDAGYWRDGADLGWTSLLVPEEAGGGSLSDAGLVDLTLVAFEFGAHAAPGPLVPTNLVAAALGETGTCPDALAAVLAGAVATTCGAEVGDDGRLSTALRVQRDGKDLLLDGTASPVESAAVAEHLLVTAHDGDALVQVLVPVGVAGVSIAPLRSVDLTRRFSKVRFEDVRVPANAVVAEAGDAEVLAERQLRRAAVLAAAEMVGAMQVAFDMTVEWAFDRYSFGRPLSSYQALKHRFADMKSWLEASHGLADAAAAAVQDDGQEAAELASASISFIGDKGSELLQDCVQLHGGIGLTFEHDLHLFLRRHTLDRGLYGTPAQHRQRLGSMASA